MRCGSLARLRPSRGASCLRSRQGYEVRFKVLVAVMDLESGAWTMENLGHGL